MASMRRAEPQVERTVGAGVSTSSPDITRCNSGMCRAPYDNAAHAVVDSAS